MTVDNKFVEENKGKRFTFTFVNGLVLKNIKLFVSSYGTIGYLSGNQKRRGYPFPIYDEIKEFVDITKKPKVYNDIDNAKSILKKIHPNAWIELQESLKNIINGESIDTDFEYHFRGELKFKNVSKYLNEHEAERLKSAFENKTEFNWRRDTMHHSGRDLSIYTRFGSDGHFRGYFNSEYMGCGNGDYWLLLNPTTAIFYETD